MWVAGRTYGRMGVSAYRCVDQEPSAIVLVLVVVLVLDCERVFGPVRTELPRSAYRGAPDMLGETLSDDDEDEDEDDCEGAWTSFLWRYPPERAQDFGAIRTTQARCCIPSGAGAERAVIPGNNVPESRWILVQSRINETDP